MFKGINDLLRMASELAESVQDENASVEVRRAGASGIPKTLRASYGISVRVGARSGPAAAPFNLGGPYARIQPEGREPLADVIDEGDHYLILVELPGAEGSQVRWEVSRDRVVIIHARSVARSYSKKIELPVAVNERTGVACYENGIFELKVWKQ